MVGLDLVLDLDMKIYEEEQTEILSDVYGVTREIDAVTGTAKLKQLLMKNTGRTRLNGRFRVAEGMPEMQQLCHSGCRIQLAEVRAVEGGLRITGAAVVENLYLSRDAEFPYSSCEGNAPLQLCAGDPRHPGKQHLAAGNLCLRAFRHPHGRGGSGREADARLCRDRFLTTMRNP